MVVVEFCKISNGKYFGYSEHPDRRAAEQHATRELLRLGEDANDVAAAVAAAGYGSADASAHGYGVRIFAK